MVTLALSGFKYLIALFMMYAGVVTVMAPPTPGTQLPLVYESRPVLIVMGIIIFLSGALLFFSKVFKKRKTQGWGLFAIYNCFLFAGFLNWYAVGWEGAWSNLLGAAIVGALYLRWKYHIYYYEPVDKTRPVV